MKRESDLPTEASEPASAPARYEVGAETPEDMARWLDRLTKPARSLERRP